MGKQIRAGTLVLVQHNGDTCPGKVTARRQGQVCVWLHTPGRILRRWFGLAVVRRQDEEG